MHCYVVSIDGASTDIPAWKRTILIGDDGVVFAAVAVMVGNVRGFVAEALFQGVPVAYAGPGGKEPYVPTWFGRQAPQATLICDAMDRVAKAIKSGAAEVKDLSNSPLADLN